MRNIAVTYLAYYNHMTKNNITNYSSLETKSLERLQQNLSHEIEHPKVELSDKIKNFTESAVFMGTTVRTVAFGAAAVVLATNEKAQELAGIENVLAEPEKLRNISLGVGALAGGLSGVINMVGTHQKQRIDQARANATELSYVNKLLDERDSEPSIEPVR